VVLKDFHIISSHLIRRTGTNENEFAIPTPQKYTNFTKQGCLLFVKKMRRNF